MHRVERERPRNVPEEGLKALQERAREHSAEAEEDEETALQELIEEFVPAEADDGTAAEPETPEPVVGPDEFTCRSCHLVLHRSLLADRRRGMCADCAGRSNRRVASGAGGGAHEIKLTCPACREPVLRPERHEGPGIFS
jgi:sarcosine oxidase gamma subunit